MNEVAKQKELRPGRGRYLNRTEILMIRRALDLYFYKHAGNKLEQAEAWNLQCSIKDAEQVVIVSEDL
jgi:hypothetical protein